MNAILEVHELTKKYGTFSALDKVSFTVEKGEVFALLGPNGAGKTTALEIIEGIRSADSGRVTVCEIDALAKPDLALRHMGIQLQTQGLPQSMTVKEALDFFSGYQRCKPRSDLLGRFGLETKKHVAFRNLSLGLQRRLMLALALAHDPEIIILDEPTAALDVEARTTLHELIREEKERGKTILLASHDMAEVEKLADRALVLVRGRIAALGSPRQLTNQGDNKSRVSMLTRDGCLATRETGECQDSWKVDAEGYVKIRTDRPGPVLANLIAAIDEAGDEILDLRVDRPSLEERFLELACTPSGEKK